MKKQKKRYILDRSVTIVLTTLILPLGTFVGYEFGAGHRRTALLALLAQTIITFLQASVYWFTMEKLNRT